MGNSIHVMRDDEEQHLPEALEAHPQLRHYKLEGPLVPGSGRMTRTYRLRHRTNDSLVVLKALMLVVNSTNTNEIAEKRRELERVRSAVQSQSSSHVAPFLAWWVVGQDNEPTSSTSSQQQPQQQQYTSSSIPRPVFLLRPHLYTTLSDRLATRPWLAPVEKLWMVHQLLQALQKLHNQDVVHGFLTTENIGLTSFNYLVLVDLSSSYKARFLADDDPSEYLYDFQLQQMHDSTTGVGKRSEKRCYLAPERFQKTPNNSSKHHHQQQQQDYNNEDDSPSLDDDNDNDMLTPAMDIFSTGCVLVELLLNGERCLDLGDLIEYRRKGEMPASLQQKLAKIESSHLRAACRHMLSLDPLQRLSAQDYWLRLDASEQFPTSSFEYLTNFLEHMTTQVLSPDARVAILAAHYSRVLWETVGERDVKGQAYLDKVLGREMLQLERIGDKNATTEEEDSVSVNADNVAEAAPRSELLATADPFSTSSAEDLFAETEALLRQLEDFNLNDDDEDEATNASSGAASETPAATDGITQSSPDGDENEKAHRSPLCKSSLLIFLQLVLATIRHVQRPASKLVALQLIERLARFSSDEARLQRIVPVIMSLLQDQDPLVRSCVLTTLTYTLSIIESFSPFDSQVFTHYIFKRVGHLISDPSLVVRIAFAKCLAVMAETAHRFLDIRHAVRLYEAVESGTGGTTPDESRHGGDYKEGNVFGDDVAKLLDTDKTSHEVAKPTSMDRVEIGKSESALVAAGKTLINSTYNTELSGLQETVSRWVIQITTDQSEHSALPKRSLLSDIGRLCHFFGLEGVMSFILPQILAFLNDRKNWELRAALFGALPSLCHVIGRAATEEFVLPCVEIGLVDVEEYVITRALSCVTSLIQMNLLSRAFLLGGGSASSGMSSPRSQNPSLLRRYGVLLMHPSEEIRHEAIKTFSTGCNAVGSPARDVYFLPLIRPLLRFEPSSAKLCSEDGLRSCIKSPWTREQFLEELTKWPVLGKTEGTWTTIGIQVREDSDAVETTASSSGKVLSEQTYESQQRDPLLGQMQEYLRMLARHTAQSPSYDRNGSALSKSEISGGIEGSVKLAQSIMFPRQDAPAQKECVPGWYSVLRDSAEAQNSTVTEASAIRSVSSLGHVYGLSIMGPAEGTAENIVGAADDSQGAEDEADDVLRAPESRVLEAAFTGQWGSETIVDPDVVDTSLLVTKLKALDVPPLPPYFGDVQPQCVPSHILPRGSTKDSASASEWKPRINALVASSSVVNGHTAPVVRLAVSMDNSFFISGSHDGSCRVWEIPNVEESVGVLESSLVYTGHSESRPTRVNDLAMVEGSHSVVSGASDGSVHVWRVDMIASSGKSPSQQSDLGRRQDRSKVVGTSTIRRIDPQEGEILAVSHFNSLSASVVTFGTQKSYIHSWDLRCAREPFTLRHGPELGHLSSVVLGNDRQWIVTGTSRGYVALWDVRFQQAVKLWRHSRQAPISRLATSVVAPPQGASQMTSEGVRPYIFAACGPNECAMFDAVTGSCQACWRTVTGDSRELNAHVEDPPFLDEIPMSVSSRGGNTLSLKAPQPVFKHMPSVASINCMVGSIGAQNHCYLITGGGDSRIRFWDFSTPSKCYIVSGLSQTQQRPSFERIDFDNQRRLMLCRQPRSPGLRDSNKLFHGPRKPDIHHFDSVQDLKILDNSALISCSRDCTVKVWR